MDKLIEWIYSKVKLVVSMIVYLYMLAVYFYGPWVVNGLLLILLSGVVYLIVKYKKKKAWKKRAAHPRYIKDLSSALEELSWSKVSYGNGWIEVEVSSSERNEGANIAALAIGNRLEEYRVISPMILGRSGHTIKKEK